MFRSFSYRSASQRPPSPDAADGRPPRIAVIDIGSNSVRMVVYESVTRSPTVLFNEKTLCGLGDELETTGRLSRTGRERAMRALTRYVELINRMNVSEVGAVGTAAVRDAADGAEFVEEVRARLGVEIAVASGKDEARLAAQGVILGDPFAEGVVADMGGASMELVRLKRSRGKGVTLAEGVTTALGPLRLRSAASALGLPGDLSDGPAKALKALERSVDEDVHAALERRPLPQGEVLYLLGGSWRALARAWMARVGYPLHVLHEYALDAAEAADMAAWGAAAAPARYRELINCSESRARVTPYAAFALARLLKALKPRRVSISAFGLREGVLWERMPDALRAQDPLLDACRAIEAADSRGPGFGAELWTWVAPLIRRVGGVDERLGEAACLLADAVWRTHPDYRGQASFELVTRNNFGGIDHRGRMFIAAALLFRFKGSKKSVRAQPAMALLDARALASAEILGRAMRLGAVMTGGTAGLLPEIGLAIDGNEARLSPSPALEALAGEEVSRRLTALNQAIVAQAAASVAVA